jgi:Ras family
LRVLTCWCRRPHPPPAASCCRLQPVLILPSSDSPTPHFCLPRCHFHHGDQECIVRLPHQTVTHWRLRSVESVSHAAASRSSAVSQSSVRPPSPLASSTVLRFNSSNVSSSSPSRRLIDPVLTIIAGWNPPVCCPVSLSRSLYCACRPLLLMSLALLLLLLRHPLAESVRLQQVCLTCAVGVVWAAVDCAGVGKSCLLLRFSDDSFTTSFITTIGSEQDIITTCLQHRLSQSVRLMSRRVLLCCGRCCLSHLPSASTSR